MRIELPINQTNDTANTLTPEIQYAFKNHIGKLRNDHQLFGRVVRVVPEQLLLVTRYAWRKIPLSTVTRTYFGLVSSIKKIT